ncbi:MAG: hypothetical protein OEV42_09400 [Deltaproteobacteria bacterium]|nr:hypothetical protein [Deltaproteobacteria bacterium]
MDFKYTEYDGKKGALILTEEGLYFQPYAIPKDSFSYFGDSLSIGITGIFGAINLTKKIEESESPSPGEVARFLRNEFSLEELKEKKLVTFFPWSKVKEVKNRTLMGTVEVKFNQGQVIKLTDPKERKEAYEIILNKLE